MKTSLLIALLLAAFVTPVPAQNRFEVRHAFPGVQFADCPVSLAYSPEMPPRGVIALQRGLVHVVPDDRKGTEAPVFLDFRERLREEIHFEAGIHAILFDPDFVRNRRVYLSYSLSDPRRNVLSVITVPVDRFEADPASEKVLLEVPHQLADHYSGSMAFGPDGMLYYGIGDGGYRDDPMGMAQHPFLLQGKILRIDVRPTAGARPYRIPRDNPYFGKQEWREEIYALGFRNPWGLSFDQENGQLWVADVGQDRFEEVNLVVAGGNYGWSERDGRERLLGRANQTEVGTRKPYIDPVHSYSRLDGDGICIVGGFVYRGTRHPSLEGCYLFADWGVGKIWALHPPRDPDGPRQVELLHTPADPGLNPTLIVPDAEGEVLVLSHRGWIEELYEVVSP